MFNTVSTVDFLAKTRRREVLFYQDFIFLATLRLPHHGASLRLVPIDKLKL
jgi:hypothetical protein